MYPSSCGGLVQSWAQLRGWLALGRASAPPACSCGRRGPGHPVQPRGGTQASRHLALGEASRVLIPGSRGSCPQRSYVCIHGRPGRGQLLGAGLHNGAAVQGMCRAGPPHSVRWGQRAHSALAERAQTPPPRPGSGRPCPDPGFLQWARGCHVAHAGPRWPGGDLHPCTALPLPRWPPLTCGFLRVAPVAQVAAHRPGQPCPGPGVCSLSRGGG